MKKQLLTALLLLTLGTALADKPISPDQLPSEAKRQINRLFPGATINRASVERQMGYNEYEVWLSDGSHVEFSSNGRWRSVENNSGVDMKLIPQKIQAYVYRHYRDCRICKVEVEGRRYDIELADGTELAFNRHFELIDVDD